MAEPEVPGSEPPPQGDGLPAETGLDERDESEELDLPVAVYEFAWILPSIAIPIGMLVALALAAYAMGIRLPGRVGTIDPNKVAVTAPFDHPGLSELSPGHYQVVMVASTWTFDPNRIAVPAGSTVTFIITSRDVVHGFMIHDEGINAMLLPGQITRVTAHFDKPGDRMFLCHEYCGIGHQDMWGQIDVEGPAS